MSEEVLNLERTKKLFEELLTDHRIHINLPQNTFYIQHSNAVINKLPMHYRFKIGITDNPDERYYNKPYAYRMQHIQEGDGVKYCGMVLIYVHHVRVRERAQTHCGNRKLQRTKETRRPVPQRARFGKYPP